MSSAVIIADALGRKRIADAVGVGTTAVSNAVVRGQFPASWFIVIQSLCDEAGIQCPPSAFGMRAAAGDAA